VWLARNAIGGYHAVKIVERARFAGAEPFDREFRGVQKFMPISRGHPGWVPILHVGRNEEAGCFFYVMEAADDLHGGTTIVPEQYEPRTLNRELAGGKCLSVEVCLRLGLDLALALSYLHEQQLVHRDIKPSNIVYLRGKPRFVDVGLVTDMAAPGRDTSFVGTVGYLAPEGPGTPAADIYSLGKVLYTALSGLEPAMFPELPTEQAEQAERTLFLEFYEAVARACEDDTRRRYGTADQLRADLERLERKVVP